MAGKTLFQMTWYVWSGTQNSIGLLYCNSATVHSTQNTHLKAVINGDKISLTYVTAGARSIVAAASCKSSIRHHSLTHTRNCLLSVISSRSNLLRSAASPRPSSPRRIKASPPPCRGHPARRELSSPRPVS